MCKIVYILTLQYSKQILLYLFNAKENTSLTKTKTLSSEKKEFTNTFLTILIDISTEVTHI